MRFSLYALYMSSFNETHFKSIWAAEETCLANCLITRRRTKDYEIFRNVESILEKNVEECSNLNTFGGLNPSCMFLNWSGKYSLLGCIFLNAIFAIKRTPNFADTHQETEQFTGHF